MELFYALSKPSCIHSLNQGEVSVYEALWITNSTLTINQSQSRTWLIYCFPWVIPITKTNRNSACWLRQSLMIDPHQLIPPSSLFPLHIDRTRGCIFQRGEMKAYWRQSPLEALSNRLYTWGIMMASNSTLVRIATSGFDGVDRLDIFTDRCIISGLLVARSTQ